MYLETTFQKELNRGHTLFTMPSRKKAQGKARKAAQAEEKQKKEAIKNFLTNGTTRMMEMMNEYREDQMQAITQEMEKLGMENTPEARAKFMQRLKESTALQEQQRQLGDSTEAKQQWIMIDKHLPEQPNPFLDSMVRPDPIPFGTDDGMDSDTSATISRMTSSLVGLVNSSIYSPIDAGATLASTPATTEKCWHGFNPKSFPRDHVCRRFMIAFTEKFYADLDKEGHDPFIEAFGTTRDEFPEVVRDHGMMELILSYLLFRCVQRFIEGDEHDLISIDIAFASFFEQYIAIFFQKSHAIIDWTKIMELLGGVDKHTVVHYLKNRIPCSCLDDKYKEVKSIKRMCFCYNVNCSRKMERKKRLTCTRCTRACYCSAECQKDHWPKHKVKCDADAALKEAAKKGEVSSVLSISYDELMDRS